MSRASLAVGAAISLVAIVALIGLGDWQLRRLAWKEGLIAAADARAHATPAPLPPSAQWSQLKPGDYEYRRVEAEGEYDYAHQELVFGSLEEPRGRYSGVGFYVMTPLRLADGAAVVVNRGFVPDALKGAADQGPRGATRVVGLMRASEARNLFTPADDPARGVYFTRDAAALAQGMKLKDPAPFLIDAEAGGEPLPQGGETRLTFVNNHLGYAFTWFGLAAALAGVFGAYAWGQFRATAPSL